MKRLPLSETVKKSKIKFYATHFLRAKSPPCHRPSIAPAFIFQRFRRSSSTVATKKPVKLTPRHSTAALDEAMAKYAYAPLSVVSFASPCCATAALGRSLPPTHALGHCRKMIWAKRLPLDQRSGRYHLLPDSGWPWFDMSALVMHCTCQFHRI